MSQRPWEQDWKFIEDGIHTRVVDCADETTVFRTGAYWHEDDFRLGAVSPRLYRALDALLDAASIDKTAPEFIEARAALKAARGEE